MKALHLFWVVPIGIWSFIGWIHLHHSIRSTAFREGYERGVIHTAGYHKRFGQYPSIAWREEYWNYINTGNEWMRENPPKP
jgi:hypothetical protein